MADLGEEGEMMPNEAKNRMFLGAVESTGKFWAIQGGRHVDAVIGMGDFDLFPVRIAASDKMLLLSSSITGRLMVSGMYLKDKKVKSGPMPPPPLKAVAHIGRSPHNNLRAPRAQLRRPGCLSHGSSVSCKPQGEAAAQTAASSAASHPGLLNRAGGIKAWCL